MFQFKMMKHNRVKFDQDNKFWLEQILMQTNKQKQNKKRMKTSKRDTFDFYDKYIFA